MRKFTVFFMTLVMIVCSMSFPAYANEGINKQVAIKTTIEFLDLVEKENYEAAKKMLIDERSIVNEFGYTFDELLEENPLSDYYIYEYQVKKIDSDKLLLPVKVIYRNKDAYIIPIVVSNTNGTYIVHLVEINDETDKLYTVKTIQENIDEKTISPNPTPKASTTKVDEYEFWNLYTSVSGSDTFTVKAGSYKISGEQTPDGWPAGSSVKCTITYAIVKATGLFQTTYGKTVVEKSGSFTAYISGTKNFDKGRILIGRSTKNPDSMRVRGSGTIYKVNS